MDRRGNGWRWFASAVALALLGVCLSRFSGDWNAYDRARDLKDAKLAELERLNAERDASKTLAEKLESDPLTKERLVRSMGYARPGEKAYVIQPTETAPAPSESAE